MKEEGFYSANEFDLIPLLNLEGEIMELGRSCVDPAHRTISMMQLLWRAVAVYVQHYQIKVLCGCASLNGIEPVNFKLPLSYLYHHHLAPKEKRSTAIAVRFVKLNWVRVEDIEPRTA